MEGLDPTAQIVRLGAILAAALVAAVSIVAYRTWRRRRAIRPGAGRVRAAALVHVTERERATPVGGSTLRSTGHWLVLADGTALPLDHRLHRRLKGISNATVVYTSPANSILQITDDRGAVIYHHPAPDGCQGEAR